MRAEQTTEIEPTTPPQGKLVRLSRPPHVPDQLREVIRQHQDRDAEIAARLVRVEAGELNRTTGKRERIFWEVTGKAPGSGEVTWTFSQKRNAELVYLAATYGIGDLHIPLTQMPSGLWRAFRDRGAFHEIETQLAPGFWLMGERPFWQDLHGAHTAPEDRERSGTRVNSGD